MEKKIKAAIKECSKCEYAIIRYAFLSVIPCSHHEKEFKLTLSPTGVLNYATQNNDTKVVIFRPDKDLLNNLINKTINTYNGKKVIFRSMVNGKLSSQSKEETCNKCIECKEEYSYSSTAAITYALKQIEHLEKEHLSIKEKKNGKEIQSNKRRYEEGNTKLGAQ